MPRPSAGNPLTASKVDASGSSSVGDIYMWFLGTGSSSAAAGKAKVEPAWLRVAGLADDVTAADVRALFSRYYNTVKEVSLASDGKGRASVPLHRCRFFSTCRYWSWALPQQYEEVTMPG